MKKLPEELVQLVREAFPSDEMVAQLLNANSPALVPVIMIKSTPEFTPEEIIAVIAAIRDYEVKWMARLLDLLEQKAKAIKNGQEWGGNSFLVDLRFEIARRVELALQGKPLADAA